jgi:hypothetical protein
MANITKSGSKTIAYKATRGALISGNGSTPLAANAWFEVAATATSGSQIPTGLISGNVFKSPDTTGSAITPIAGDNVYPLTLVQMFKTDAEISCEEGTIDVTDDSVAGFTSMILDGYKAISGSLNGFAKVDDSTGVLSTDTLEVIGRFFDKVTDSGLGVYTFTASENEKFLLFYCLNKDAIVTGTQNWLIFPILLSSLGTGAGLKDSQKRDLSWVKAEGPATLYTRVVFTADLI